MIGTNWRMMEVAAALGIVQLEQLQDWTQLRSRNARIWADALQAIPTIRSPLPEAGVAGAFYRFYAYVQAGHPRRAELRDDIIRICTEKGLNVSAGCTVEMYRGAAFSGLSLRDVPVAKELAETSLAFEVHPTLDPQTLSARASEASKIIEGVLSRW